MILHKEVYGVWQIEILGSWTLRQDSDESGRKNVPAEASCAICQKDAEEYALWAVTHCRL